MTQEEIKNEIARLKAKNLAMSMQVNAIGLAGAIGGVIYATKTKRSTWGKVGFFFLGSIIAGIPSTIIFAPKAAENVTKIQQLESQLE